MASLLVHIGTFYSPRDEESFFRWLGSIPGVRAVKGTANGLQVSLKSATLSEPALRDLIALHWRYSLPMRDLRMFKTEKNEVWFGSSTAYWFEAVFGERALPANIELRLASLRLEGATPVEAIKAIHRSYSVSLSEAKRRLSLSPAWAAFTSASSQLQDEAIFVATSFAERGHRDAA